jgi:glycosyltransferase involved in cell wall biosynthesis
VPLSHPLRVLLVVDSLDMGGAERHVVDLASALVRAGHAVTVACSRGGSLARSAETAGVTVRSLLHQRVKRRLSLPFAWQLANLIRHERFDLVHAHIYASEVASALATLGRPIPLVLTEHTEAGWRSNGARWLSRFAYRRAAHIIAVSSRIERRLIKHDGVPPGRVAVIPNGLPRLPAAASLPAVLPLADRHNGPMIGVIARLQPEKGVAYFLRAAAQVAQQASEAQFLVIGDGPLRPELEALSDQLGLHGRVHFLGLRLDAPALVAGLDVLAVPSLSEGTSLRVLEAMAAAVPIVASGVGGIPEQIHHEREGMLVPPGDPRALAAAILKLLEDPARARRLGEAGRQRVASCFSYDAMLRQVLAVYGTALRAKPSRRPAANAAPSSSANRGRRVRASLRPDL